MDFCRSESSNERKKPKKTPIPLPRARMTKKFSADSIGEKGSYPSDSATAEMRPEIPPKHISQSASNISNTIYETASIAASTGSNSSTRSLNKVSSTTELVNGGTDAKSARPTYINLSSVDMRQMDKSRETAECKDPGNTSSPEQPIYYNVSKSCELACAKENGSTTGGRESTEIAPHDTYPILPPSEAQSTAQSEMLDTQATSNVESDSPNSPQSPTMDEFLAHILQRRRESKDINEACDNRKRTPGRLTLSRTWNKDPRQMMHIMGLAGTANTAPTPHYYNLPPLLRSNAVSDDYDLSEEEEVGGEKMILEESYGEKEYRSAWLRRQSGANKNLIQKEDEAIDSHDYGTPTYLRILPLTIDSSHPRSLPSTETSHMKMHDVATKEFSTEVGMSIPEESESSSTPESGSPLWGSHRASSRLAVVVSPLTLEGGENDSDNPTLQDPSTIPLRIKRHTRTRRVHGFRSSYDKRLIGLAKTNSSGEKVAVAVAGDGRRASNAKMLAYKIAIRKRSLGKLGPLPSLPYQNSSDSEQEVESDYEWAEIGEALSDTGSDIYTKPDLPPFNIDANPRRSASCSELAHCLPLSSEKSLSQRPPALLPTTSQGTIALADYAVSVTCMGANAVSQHSCVYFTCILICTCTIQ